MRVAPEVDLEARRGSSKTAIVGRVMDQLPHDKLNRRKVIDASQYAAAERMHALCYRAGLVPAKAQAYEKLDHGQAESPESVAIAKNLYLTDLALLDPRGASVVHNVCGYGLTCAEWAAKFSTSRSDALEWLCKALTEIAQRHGL